jgi:dynein heavy chain 2, cytosolic
MGQYEELAMGGGQQEIAMHMVRTAAQQGSWICLKNLHLVVAWLPSLEKELSSLQPHPDFRLWLTSEPHHGFPSILLQESLKATFESPPGLKKNLQRTFDVWGPEVFEGISPVQARLLFLLACFHSVVQERRNFIPQGWTKFYEFSYGDLKAGTFVMQVRSSPRSLLSDIDDRLSLEVRTPLIGRLFMGSWRTPSMVEELTICSTFASFALI